MQRHETFPPDDLAGCRLEICHWERRTAGQGGRKSWCRDLYLQVALKMKFQRELISLPFLRWSGKIIYISSFAEPVFHKLGSWRREISGLTCWNLLPGCRRWDWENIWYGLLAAMRLGLLGWDSPTHLPLAVNCALGTRLVHSGTSWPQQLRPRQ